MFPFNLKCSQTLAFARLIARKNSMSASLHVLAKCLPLLPCSDSALNCTQFPYDNTGKHWGSMHTL